MIIIKGLLSRGKEIQPLSAYTVWRRTDERDIQIDLTNIEPSGKNRTVNSNLLIYNRVPKCSSTTMKFLMQKLQKHNKFHAFFSTNYWRQQLRLKDERQLMKEIQKNRKRKYYYNRHFFMFDAEILNSTKAVNFMNMIRNPVDRVVSEFYFNRWNARWNVKFMKKKPPRKWFQKDFSECVLTNDPECQIGLDYQFMQLTYFCGSHQQCSNSTNPRALQLAKYNLENRYSVVGVMEHWNVSLEVFEQYLPGFQ